MHPPRLAGRANFGERTQVVEVLLHGRVAFDGGAAGPVELEFVVEHERIGNLEVTHLADLGVGEFHLSRTTARHDVDILDVALGQCLERVVSDVGVLQFVHRFGQHTRHVHGHIADADDDRRVTAQIDLQVPIVRMAVVPGHEFGGRHAVGQILAGNVQLAVRLGSGRVEDDVIMLLEVCRG